MFDWFHKTLSKHFLCFVNEDNASLKKHVISTPIFLSLLLQEKMRLNKRRVGGWEGMAIKRCGWNIYKSSFEKGSAR